MQTETTATAATTETAQTVDTTAATTTAPASAEAGTTATDEGTSTTTGTEGDSGTQQETEQERNDKGQFKSGAQKRIDALVYQRHQAEREAAYWKQQAQATQTAAAPKLADFDSHDEFDQAMLQHRIDEGVNRGLTKTAEQQATKFVQEAQSAAAEAYNQRATEIVTRIPDFVEVVSKSSVPMSPALHEALMDSEKGPDLVYHLAKNPAEAERLNNMSVRQMDREIGRLESTFGLATKPPPPAARTTSAPAPIKPGSQASAPANTDPNKMDQAQFEAWAKANGSRYIR